MDRIEGAFVVFLCVIISVVGYPTSKETIPFAYPLFKQCNDSWGNDVMEQDTICEVGCLLSSVSMALNGKAIPIDSAQADPGTLNQWLQNNDGYIDGDDLVESVVPNINPSRIKWVAPYFNNTALSPTQLKRMLQDGQSIVIANVLEGSHFVLVVGYDSGDVNWYVNDPGFDTDYYTYDSIVGWRIFSMR